MKSKMKLLTAFAAIVCAVGLFADTLVVPVTVTTSATQTVYTNEIAIPAPTVGSILGGTPVYRPFEKIVVKNNTLSSASVAVEMEDLDEWTTLTGSPVVAATTAQTVGYPWRAVTESHTGYVTTNRLVMCSTGDGGTNYTSQLVAVPVTTTVTKYMPYSVHRLRLITTLNATNAASTVKAAVHFQ